MRYLLFQHKNKKQNYQKNVKNVTHKGFNGFFNKKI